VLSVSDNGRGIRDHDITNPKSLGLLGMRERALVFGGRVDITAVVGGGTRLTIRIPREGMPGNNHH
jgi:signal transduction histidine kinase